MANDPELSAAQRRAEYRDQLAELAEANPEASGPELARMLSSQLTRRERDELAFDYLNSISVFAQQYRYMVSRDRQMLRRALAPRDPNMREYTKAEDAPTLYDFVQSWKEAVPNVGYRQVLKMTRPMLQAVIDQRMKGVMTDVFWIELLRRLVAGLANDNTLVEGQFSEPDIAALAANVQKEMQRGNLRLRIQSIPALPGAPGLPRQAGRRNAV